METVPHSWGGNSSALNTVTNINKSLLRDRYYIDVKTDSFRSLLYFLKHKNTKHAKSPLKYLITLKHHTPTLSTAISKV